MCRSVELTISLTRCAVIRRVERDTIQEVVRSPRHLLRNLPPWSVEDRFRTLSGAERKKERKKERKRETEKDWLVRLNAGLSRKRYWRGPGPQEVCGWVGGGGEGGDSGTRTSLLYVHRSEVAS